MIIDLILDRRDGVPYDDAFEKCAYLYEEAQIFHFDELAQALDGGTESDVRNALCRYVDANGYGHIPGIKEYIRSVRWLPEE